MRKGQERPPRSVAAKGTHSAEKPSQRSDVPPELTWDLTHIFPSADAWLRELSAVEEAIQTVLLFKGKLNESGSVLLSCLEAHDDLLGRFNCVKLYAALNLSVDGLSPERQSAAARAGALGARLLAETVFVRFEVQGLSGEELERFYATEPGLEQYRWLIERFLEERPHTLGQDTEVALSLLSEVLDSPESIYKRARGADMSFEGVIDGSGNKLPMSLVDYEQEYESSPETLLRRNAHASLTKGLWGFRNTLAATWAAEVRKKVMLARLRGYDSATSMILAEQEVTEVAYSNLLSILFREIAPCMRRLAELRRKVLGLDRLMYCDIEAPLDPEYNPEITYEAASAAILDGLSVLGPGYTEIIEHALQDRWIDLADNRGKWTGASCNHVHGVHPYIRIIWNDSMRAALLLAHELGHAAYHVMAQRDHRFSNTRTSRFFLETPSTFSELQVGRHILDQSTDGRARRWALMQLLAIYHRNFVTHLIEAELQRRTYAVAESGQPLTEQLLSRIQGEILEEFWGDTVEIDAGARMTWMRQAHYYKGLYPYTYSAGMVIATAVADAIRKEGQPAAQRWLEVLRVGSTRKPLELARMSGVDLTDPEPILRTVKSVARVVDEVAGSF